MLAVKTETSDLKAGSLLGYTRVDEHILFMHYPCRTCLRFYIEDQAVAAHQSVCSIKLPRPTRNSIHSIHVHMERFGLSR